MTSNTFCRRGWAIVAVCVGVALSAAPARSADVGYAFTYQGSLSDNNAAPSAPYDFSFRVFNAPAGGVDLAGFAITFEDKMVLNGIFSMELNFGNAPLQGSDVWLEVGVRPGASTGAFTPLPRQRLSASPFAIGMSLPHSQTHGSALPLFKMSNTGTGHGAEFSTASGNGGAYGVRGIYTGTGFNSAGVRGEATGASGNVIGVEGVALNSSDGAGLVGRGKMTGAYIEGLDPGATGLYAYGHSRAIWAQNLSTGSAINAVGQGPNTLTATILSTNTGGGSAISGFGGGLNVPTLYAANGNAGHAIHAFGNGQGATHATLRVENNQTVQGMAAFLTNNSDYATAHFENDGNGQILWLEHDGTGDFIRCNGATGYKFWVDNAGVTHTKVLEILGGADLSERFDVHTEDSEIEPGTVVCIDRDQEGRLEVSRGPYDRRVAGIISGAGGVEPGMLMGQKGSVADGEHPVALTGRVYVRATAVNGPISPGDLLTTSSIPGHAMRVDDHARAQGAVLGKAMGSLAKGEGLVLVLVGLQ